MGVDLLDSVVHELASGLSVVDRGDVSFVVGVEVVLFVNGLVFSGREILSSLDVHRTGLVGSVSCSSMIVVGLMALAVVSVLMPAIASLVMNILEAADVS